MPVKELHLAQSMNDLLTKCKIKKDAFKDWKYPDKLVSKLKKLKHEANEAISNNDEEQAFMYTYRALEVWDMLRNTSDFKNNTKFYKLTYGKEIKVLVDKLTQYSNSLEMRYASKGNADVKTKDGLNAQFELLSSIDIKNKSLSKSKTEEQSYSNKLNCSTEKKHLSDFKLIIGEDSETKTSSDCIGGRITCQVLKDKIASRNSVLIIDIRPPDDFIKSKIKDVDSINISTTQIRQGLSAHLLGEQIQSDDQKIFWKCRDQYDQVVLMDWSGLDEENIIPDTYNNSLFTLCSILQKWDPDVLYKNNPLILTGGFTCWMDCYPNSITNKNIINPERSTSNPSTSMLGFTDIEYPILEDITSPNLKSKPKTPGNSSNTSDIPSFDRSTKNGASKKFNSEDSSRNTFKGSIEETIHDQNTGNLFTSAEDPHDGLQQSHLLSPTKLYDKGDGNGITNTEKIKVDKLPQITTLKRSASSPNINKIGVDFDSSESFTPTFDRSKKPNQNMRLEHYLRDAGNDTVYAADNKKGVGLTGLKNFGNLCYMNSIMQCISNTVQLRKSLTQFNLNKDTNRQLIATEVRSLLRILWQGDSKITSCRELKGKVGKLKNSFSTSEQQDSHEFLTLIMDWLHEDLNIPSSIKSLEGADESTGEKAWGEFKLKNDSIIIDLFYGQLKSTVTCKSCGKESVLFEPFSNLSIPLPPQESLSDHKCSLQDCLTLYLKGETISGWICPSCKCPRDAMKKLDISRLPPILIIHLKRFMTEAVGGNWCRKRMDFVNFPLYNLDMKPYTPVNSEQRFHNYKLYAVSNHYGNMDSGHYTAYCKNNSHQRWYKFDDQDVSEMSQNDVRSSAAYILFYENNLNDEY